MTETFLLPLTIDEMLNEYTFHIMFSFLCFRLLDTLNHISELGHLLPGGLLAPAPHKAPHNHPGHNDQHHDLLTRIELPHKYFQHCPQVDLDEEQAEHAVEPWAVEHFQVREDGAPRDHAVEGQAVVAQVVEDRDQQVEWGYQARGVLQEEAADEE
jgi:hypothetical protein